MKHIGLTAAGVLSVITAATVFLCVGTGTGVAEEAAPIMPVQAAVAESRDEAVVLSHAVFVGESVPFGPRAQRHAFDALQVAEELGGEDMGWQYVQLRL